jgi:hypothetical protein
LNEGYVAVSMLQQTYISLSDKELGQCEGEWVRICPADKAVKSTRTDSCALGLFFQRRNVREVCRRIITVESPTLMLERQGTLFLYYTAEPQGTHFRCREAEGWTSVNLMLEGAGTLEGSQSCHITSGELQLYAEIRGSSQFEVPTPHIIIPSQIAVTSDSELGALRNVLDTGKVDEIIATVSAHKMEANVDDLVKLHPTSTPHTYHNDWIIPLLLATSSILVVMVIHVYARTYLRTLLKCCTSKESPKVLRDTQSNPTQPDTPSSAAPTNDTLTPAGHTRQDFAAYAVHQP